jgi:hypothetical protein
VQDPDQEDYLQGQLHAVEQVGRTGARDDLAEDRMADDEAEPFGYLGAEAAAPVPRWCVFGYIGYADREQ